ncbi:MAG: PQQ-binding-like beta-propeller repeat protein [Pseudohongiella sp.]|nr:PQQ-binding-like beta-propeller repeat protein [Pseudohongiella sp.]
MIRLKHLSLMCAIAATLNSYSALSQTSPNPLLQALTPVTDEMLRNPPAEDWLNWRRTYDTFGFSPLDQINTDNVSQLAEAWRVPLEPGSNTPTPLVHDGVMFMLATNDTLLAMDASSGEMLWTYKHETAAGAMPSAKVGIALHGDMIIMPTNDIHVLAIHAKTGKLIWDHAIEGARIGRRAHQLHATPLVANGMVIQGVTATMVPEGGYIVGLDLETGDEVWRFYSIPRPGEPGDETWNALELSARSGGSVWMPPSYDPELDLVYFGTAPTYDTASLLNKVDIPGINNDGLYTNSTVALRSRTGELAWHYQHIANDQWDLDWTYERQIMRVPVNGVMRKAVVTAGKMALFDALDAATGEYLYSLDLGLQNLIASIDPVTGAKTMNPNAAPIAESSQFVCPFAAGGRNWQASSYNPNSKVLFMPIAQMCMIGGQLGGNSILSTGASLTPAPFPDREGEFGRLQAVNMETRELLWDYREMAPPTTAIVATAGDVIFGGMLDHSFKAINANNGEILWQTSTGDIPASYPITYMATGKQHVAVVVGQPTIHAGTFMGAVTAMTGGADGPMGKLQNQGPALIVYALE